LPDGSTTSLWQLIGQVLSLVDRKAKYCLWSLGILFLIVSLLESFSVALLFWLFKLIVEPAAFAESQGALFLRQWSGITTNTGLVATLCLILFGVFVAKSSFFLLTAWMRADLEWNVRRTVSSTLLDGYLRSPYLFHLRRQSSDLYNNVHTSVGNVCQSIIRLCELASDGLLLIGLTAMMLYLSPWATLTAVVAFSVISLIYVALANRHFHHWGQIQKDTAQRLFQIVSESLAGIKQIKTLGAESFFTDGYRERMRGAAWAGVRNTFFSQLLKPTLEILVVGGLLGTIGFMLAVGQAPAEVVPVLALLGAAAYRVMPATARIVSAIQGLQFSRAAVGAVYRDVTGFREGGLPLLAPASKKRYRLRESLRLEGVCAEYDEARGPVLHDISLSIRKHESVGLVGPSGAGKTTLADIILGLLAPTKGTVWVDDIQVEFGESAQPGLFGYVPQETFLIDASIRSNVALGVPEDEIDDGRVTAALQAAQLDQVVAALPEGTAALVGERGLRLSGGQRQRLAIARALYHDPDVLVLDEATSSLDSVTEAEVSDAIARLQGEKTMVIIAHRLSTLKHCDRLVLLEGGRLADTGTFLELLHRNATFREMVRQMELTGPDNDVARLTGNG
jgi:ATP-binding cassette subfamily C protein